MLRYCDINVRSVGRKDHMRHPPSMAILSQQPRNIADPLSQMPPTFNPSSSPALQVFALWARLMHEDTCLQEFRALFCFPLVDCWHSHSLSLRAPFPLLDGSYYKPNMCACVEPPPHHRCCCSSRMSLCMQMKGPVAAPTRHDNGINCMAWIDTQQSRLLATGGRDGIVKIWK